MTFHRAETLRGTILTELHEKPWWILVRQHDAAPSLVGSYAWVAL